VAMLGTDKNLITWDVVVVSVIVLLGIAAMLWLVIREEVPANRHDMVALILGTLAIDGVERGGLLDRIVERINAREYGNGENLLPGPCGGRCG
jgi:hypothetical protein